MRVADTIKNFFRQLLTGVCVIHEENYDIDVLKASQSKILRYKKNLDKNIQDIHILKYHVIPKINLMHCRTISI